MSIFDNRITAEWKGMILCALYLFTQSQMQFLNLIVKVSLVCSFHDDFILEFLS